MAKQSKQGFWKIFCIFYVKVSETAKGKCGKSWKELGFSDKVVGQKTSYVSYLGNISLVFRDNFELQYD